MSTESRKPGDDDDNDNGNEKHGNNNNNNNNMNHNSPPAAAAAATAASVHASVDDDATVARKLLALDQLTTVFGFPASVAEQAMEITGSTDATVCYNYILDAGLSSDPGGPVTPIEHCPHIAKHVKITSGGLPIRPQSTVCTYYQEQLKRKQQQQQQSSASSSNGNSGNLKAATEDDGTCPAGENWLCLECGVIRCSRYVNGHGVAHWKETITDTDTAGHCIHVSLADLSVWCHVCNAYLRHPSLHDITKQLEHLKFAVPESVPYRKKARSCENLADEQYVMASLARSTVSANTTAAAATETTTPAAMDPKMKPIQQHDSEEAAHEEDNSSDNEANSQDDKDTQKSDDNGNDSNDEEMEGGHQDDDDDDDDNHAQEDESDDDEEDHDNGERDDSLFQMIAAAAAAQGIPLEMIVDYAEEQAAGPIQYPFESLPESLADIAQFILSENCRSVLILAGAGMSVASGIPDFRSADGLYATMNPDLLTCNVLEREAIRADPTVALEHGMFLNNPLPCLELNREFILGTRARRWKATLAHRFVELLHAKTGKLVRLYTQNIDGLEDQCEQLPRDKVIAVHGSMDRAECALCKSESDFDDFCNKVERQIKDLSRKDARAPLTSTPIVCDTCGSNTMKPAIVLFRSSLPKAFFDNTPKDIEDVDLLLVIGTSLRVAPANSLVWRVPKSALRVLVNREETGSHLGMDFGEDSRRDYFAEGDCEDVLLELMEQLGWLDDLQPLLDQQKLPDASAKLLRDHLEMVASNAPAAQDDR